MSVNPAISNDGKTLTLSVHGELQISEFRAFREAYAGFSLPGGEVRVNFASANYIDSSALGMLILLHEHASQLKQKVHIEAPPPSIRHILQIASFDKLFPIS